jgi:hypothetical protein
MAGAAVAAVFHRTAAAVAAWGAVLSGAGAGVRADVGQLWAVYFCERFGLLKTGYKTNFIYLSNLVCIICFSGRGY